MGMGKAVRGQPGLSQTSLLTSPYLPHPSPRYWHLLTSSSASITSSRAPRTSTHVGSAPEGLGEGGQGLSPLPLNLLLV